MPELLSIFLWQHVINYTKSLPIVYFCVNYSNDVLNLGKHHIMSITIIKCKLVPESNWN